VALWSGYGRPQRWQRFGLAKSGGKPEKHSRRNLDTLGYRRSTPLPVHLPDRRLCSPMRDHPQHAARMYKPGNAV